MQPEELSILLLLWIFRSRGTCDKSEDATR